MALFFDAAWFDAKLASVHLSRGDLARALGLSESQIVEMWKDQRELSAQQVTIVASLLGVNAKEIATHAGVSTPVPQDNTISAGQLDARLARIERSLEELKAMLRELKQDRA